MPSRVHFTVPPISTQQISELLPVLEPTKATVIDGIRPKSLSILPPSIVSLINKRIETETFPSQLKVAKLFHIYKTWFQIWPNNRSISVLPTISKRFEKHINKHILGLLNKYNLIYENQRGFRLKHSCQTALIKLIDQWMACTDKEDIVETLFLFFWKSFDYFILLSKLLIYQLNNSSLKLLASYF